MKTLVIEWDYRDHSPRQCMKEMEKYMMQKLMRLAEHIALDPYALTPDQWASEARAALDADLP